MRSCLYIRSTEGWKGRNCEQVQAICHAYEGRDVFLWLLTGFVNPSAMKFSLVLRPLFTKPLYGRSLGTFHVGKVRVLFFTERKTEYVTHAQTVCTRPSSRFVGGAWVQG